ncbi:MULTISPECIES: helix-turn-helix transcriptional regulator [unclassified Sphingomonas]|uniref:helix-turn-helix domain-containing protein n=1 Tax=unclassified Sphingomonas TaxID=196159 RepID=UPI00257F0483|nr:MULTISPECIES: helix-turn-helix transcriptional regulator [unclassified Sphingomonas]
MNRSPGQEALLAVLRRHLRGAGWSVRRIAEALSASEPTIKRWLAGRGLTLDRLEALAGLCDVSLADLVRESEAPPPHLANELTLAQEKALSEDILLSFLFIAILSGENWQELAQDLAIPAATMEAMLGRLYKLALIDRLPGGRARTRINPHIVWRKLPMRRQFELQMKRQFLEMDFSADDAVYGSTVIKLSEAGAAQMAEMIERHRRELSALAVADRAESHLPRGWHAVLSAARPLDLTQLREMSQG